MEQSDEQRTGTAGPGPVETSQEIVAGLTRFQIAQLKKLGKADEAMTAIRRLVELDAAIPSRWPNCWTG